MEVILNMIISNTHLDLRSDKNATTLNTLISANNVLTKYENNNNIKLNQATSNQIEANPNLGHYH